LWRSGKSASAPPVVQAADKTSEDTPDAKPGDGGFQAMDQMANWVRFADTKATILTAGLGVVLTMLMTNVRTVMGAIAQGRPAGCVVGTLAVSAILAFVWTLGWLVRAIGPQRNVQYAALNRFAWPSLLRTTTQELTDHAALVDVRRDAWQQVRDLSLLADRKFHACGRAVWGFAALVILGLSCVAVAVAATA
jgi:hypothetical protein